MDASLIRQMKQNYGEEESGWSDVGPNEAVLTKRQRKNCGPDLTCGVFDITSWGVGLMGMLYEGGPAIHKGDPSHR